MLDFPVHEVWQIISDAVGRCYPKCIFSFVFAGAIVWRYDFLSKEWRGDKTLACVGDLLELAKGKEGAQRNAFMVEFINQEDPFAKYIFFNFVHNGKVYSRFCLLEFLLSLVESKDLFMYCQI